MLITDTVAQLLFQTDKVLGLSFGVEWWWNHRVVLWTILEQIALAQRARYGEVVTTSIEYKVNRLILIGDVKFSNVNGSSFTLATLEGNLVIEGAIPALLVSITSDCGHTVLALQAVLFDNEWATLSILQIALVMELLEVNSDAQTKRSEA